MALLHLDIRWSSLRAFLDFRGFLPAGAPAVECHKQWKDVRVRAADAGVIRSTARRRRKATRGALRWLQGCIRGLETLNFQPTRPIVQGFLAFDDSEWCLQPHQGLCVAGQDRQTGCPPALRSQKAAAAASSCDNVAIYRII